MKNNIYIIHIVIFITCISILFPLFYFFINIIPLKIDVSKINLKNNNNIIYNIDRFQEKSFGTILVRGWIINKNEDNSIVNIKVLCENIDTGNVYEVKTFSDKRVDVTEAIDDMHNYDFSGFNSRIVKFMLPEKGQYKVKIMFMQSDKFKQYNKNFIIETAYSFYKR